jgi:small-conductance mechanosensitive channel
MSTIILRINPYIIWIRALIIFIVGFLIVNAFGNAIYDFFDERSEETASSLRTVTRIVGFGVLLAITVSMLNVDPAAAVAMASFLGIAIGFAGQHVLGEILAGIMIVINRPIKPGEIVTISGRTGVVKEISLTRVRIELPGGKQEVLIPSSVIISSNILRSRRPDE